jgi:glycerol kinase
MAPWRKALARPALTRRALAWTGASAALLAQAGFSPGVVKATFGTGSSVMAVIPPGGGRPPAGLGRTIAWQHGEEPPAIAAEGNIAAAAAAVRWVARLLGRDDAELARLASGAAEGGDGPEGRDGSSGSAGPSDGHGLVLVPAFGGLGAPHWDRGARAILVGMTQATGQAELARAAFESVVFQVADTFALADQAVGGAAELRADGGMSASDRFMQMQADLIGRPVRRAAGPEASALGAAYLAGLAAGQWTRRDLEAAGSGGTVFPPRADEQWRTRRLAEWHDALARSRLG